MKVAEKIAEKIAALPDGSTFRYQELPIERAEYTAAAKAIERLIKNGLITRASTGLFYKPKRTAFGVLKPDEQELLKPYLFSEGKRIAYITGTLLYNRLGLTTQVPKNIKIATRDKRLELTLGNLKVTSIKSYADISDDNYRYLEYLDAIKDFKTIPDLNKEAAVKLLKDGIGKMEDPKLFVRLALNYPPRVRALAGAMMELISPSEDIHSLRKSLNPLSSFEFGLSSNLLPNGTTWNIT
ncbi:DUF6088 family protein [Mucilaginibacter sp.]|uniref:DUF6088 family protein n=1 Tax=Mucilaginibacter sp. TaxID=1882438 RepID=UPI0035BBB421